MDVMYEKLCARVSLWFITCPAVVHLYIIQALCYRMSSSIVYFWVCNVTHVLRVFFFFFSFSENSWNLLQHEESAQARAPSPSFFFFRILTWKRVGEMWKTAPLSCSLWKVMTVIWIRLPVTALVVSSLFMWLKQETKQWRSHCCRSLLKSDFIRTYSCCHLNIQMKGFKINEAITANRFRTSDKNSVNF